MTGVDSAVQLSFPRQPRVIGIAGCSGSGKTTLALELSAELNASLLPLDFYYRDLSHLTPAERAVCNFDHPDSLETMLLIHHVQTLAAGSGITAPAYSFSTHSRVPGGGHPVEARDTLVVEGILALHYPELRALYDLSVYVHAPHEVCLRRRIHRDVRERGRTEESVREQFWATAHPMAEQFVLPSAGYASLQVDGTDSLDWSVEQVLSRLRRLG